MRKEEVLKKLNSTSLVRELINLDLDKVLSLYEEQKALLSYDEYSINELLLELQKEQNILKVLTECYGHLKEKIDSDEKLTPSKTFRQFQVSEIYALFAYSSFYNSEDGANYYQDSVFLWDTARKNFSELQDKGSLKGWGEVPETPLYSHLMLEEHPFFLQPKKLKTAAFSLAGDGTYDEKPGFFKKSVHDPIFYLEKWWKFKNEMRIQWSKIQVAASK